MGSGALSLALCGRQREGEEWDWVRGSLVPVYGVCQRQCQDSSDWVEGLSSHWPYQEWWSWRGQRGWRSLQLCGCCCGGEALYQRAGRGSDPFAVCGSVELGGCAEVLRGVMGGAGGAGCKARRCVLLVRRGAGTGHPPPHRIHGGGVYCRHRAGMEEAGGDRRKEGGLDYRRGPGELDYG